MAWNEHIAAQGRRTGAATVAAAGSPKAVEFDLEYARRVIVAEAEAIAAMTPIVNGAFARAAGMIYHCRGSCIVSGIGKAGIIGRKISATLAATSSRTC
jgi:arabinose-5-phosphate isomerase